MEQIGFIYFQTLTMRPVKTKSNDFATRVVSFAIVEGLFFSSSFACIFWIKIKNILPGLCLFTEYISRDE